MRKKGGHRKVRKADGQGKGGWGKERERGGAEGLAAETTTATETSGHFYTHTEHTLSTPSTKQR